MIEYRLNEQGLLVEVETGSEVNKELTFDSQMVESGFWSKFKSFMFRELNFSSVFPRVSFELDLTDYEKKVFGEVRDFWTKDVRTMFFNKKD